jgi:hypothetical protein
VDGVKDGRNNIDCAETLNPAGDTRVFPRRHRNSHPSTEVTRAAGAGCAPPSEPVVTGMFDGGLVMIHRIIALFAAALLSFVAVANDDDKGKRGADTFKALDRNADERLSQTEASGDQEVAQHFAALDKDADGYLTKREYTAHMKGDKKEKMGREY